MRVAVITEAFNEERNISTVLEKIPEDYDVYVVDDGSTDNTPIVCRQHNVNLIKHPVNLGQAIAFVTGLKVTLMGDYDYVIHLDADNQHEPTEIGKFVAALEEDDHDVIVGSRLLGSQEASSVLRKIFLPIFNKIITKITGYEITDYLCGFRGYKCSSLRRHWDIFEYLNHPNYNATEMFLLFAMRDFKIKEIPVQVKKRRYGKSTKGEITYGIQIINTVMRHVLNRKKYKKD